MDEIIGQRFGKLTVLSFDHFYVKPSDKKKEKRWKCQCDCGGFAVTSKRKLQSGHTSSCGCITKTRGGITKKPEFQPTYSVWNMMVQRTLNENFRGNTGYFGRISICESWLGSDGFHNFISDMGLRPSLKHSIERKDVNGDYSKENCIWTDDNSLQVYNQRLHKRNNSGKTGVGITEYGWYAEIRKGVDRRRTVFDTFEQAAAQRDAWELELYGFNKDNSERSLNER